MLRGKLGHIGTLSLSDIKSHKGILKFDNVMGKNNLLKTSLSSKRINFLSTLKHYNYFIALSCMKLTSL